MYKSSKKFMPTYILIAANVLAYVYTSILSGNLMTTSDPVILTYGQVNSFVIDFGWYWQLFTSMFVHVNIVHLVGNMLFLFIFGLRAEDLFDVKEYLLIYFLTGLVGNLLTLSTTLLLGFDMVSAGASGAIFGLFGAVTVYVRRAIGQSIIGALVFAFFLLVISSGPEVNNFAHLGGLVIGLLLGYMLATTRKPNKTHQYSYTYQT